ncbi:MAG: RNA-binding transcriptional accessory protein, partial [Planctomycetes bacterium]|nr:RNA-binding transcriptional accessory protein [Planctomycetota bacterium]
ETQVWAVVELLDAGNTVPFITRYRRDQTGGLDEEQIRRIQAALQKLRMVAERKMTILRSIESQGKLTPELSAQIEGADSIKRLEDLYLPFKPKKQTLATAARERGLEPLARQVLSADPGCADLDARAADFFDEDKKLTSVAEVLLGVGHILAETFSERADVRGALRKIFRRTGKLVTSKGSFNEKNEKIAQKAKRYSDYFDFNEPLSKVPPHRVLAINRGAKSKFLRVKMEADVDAMQAEAEKLLVSEDHKHGEFLRGCVKDLLGRLLLPSLEREVRREWTEAAENHAVKVFARNLRNLLLQPPVRGRRVLAIDPGFRHGCKLAAVDEFGDLLDAATVHIVGKEERKEAAKKTILELIDRHQLTLVAIGNGTAARETEQLISDMLAEGLKDRGVAYVIVNEAGASVYSTSPLGREEFPDCDPLVRGAISIGRRLQDPLSELVKIDPASIGVGMYQHDVKAKHLQASLDAVVESCVNFVAVDLNSASPALLRYVSGLNQLTSRRLYEYRREHGPFTSREQLKKVPGLGEATFVQATGFLKIEDGDNPLDATWIHPESYEVAIEVLKSIDATPDDLRSDAVAHGKATTSEETASDETAAVEASGNETAAPAVHAAAPSGKAALAERLAKLDVPALAEKLQSGEMLLRDIIAQLTRPGRDPREDMPPPMFKSGVLKMEDLEEGMELSGTVLNVVDFGAFIDVGLHDSGLVHVSQLANRFIKDPHEAVAVGDIVRVWVVGIDKERRRVALTMVK